MRHLIVIVAVICALVGDGWAQNRGSARYVPPEDFDGEITRAPRPTRGGVRRQRPTTAPEPVAVAAEDEVKAYEPPVRTTARRVPQRGNPQQVAPPPPPHLPVEDTVPRYSAPVEEPPQAAPTGPEGRPQGTRRRRPKKRRRPQNAIPKATEETEKQVPAVGDEEKTSLTELLNEDKKRSGVFQNNPISRNSPSTYNSDNTFQPEKVQWESNPPSGQQSNAAGPQYFRPQPATNRLPIANSEPVGNSRGYLESSPAVPEADAPALYVPRGPQSSVPNDASYVPVLPPIRVPSEDASRLPFRGHSNRPHVADPEEIIRDTDAKPVHNIIPQSDEPSVPVRSHSENRLPENKQHLPSSQYAPPSYDSSGDLLEPSTKISEDAKDPPNASNRLPNPSEVHYDSVYPEYSDSQTRGSQRVAGRRQETDESTVRNPLPSYSTPRRDTGTKPQEYDNDAEIDRRQVSQYRPPIQRGGSRYKADDSDRPTRTRTQEDAPTTTVPRIRGSSRYQPPAAEYVPERTRSSSRTNSESPVDPSSRTRSSTTSHSTTRTRGTQRYVPDTVGTGPRAIPRRTTVNTEEIPLNSPSAGYVPVEDFNKNQEGSPSHSPSQIPTNSRSHSQLQDDGSVRNTLRSRTQIPSNPRTDSQLTDDGSVRNTLRSRPQYEVSDPEAAHGYEESVEDQNIYNPDHQIPRQRDSRERPSQRTPVQREQPPQPQYQLPPNRQQNRQQYDYEPPQNSRSRPQPQYQPPQYQPPPQNPRVDSRQSNNRQNSPSSRPQERSRHQNEPSAPPRHSVGKSDFKCPDAFGFFADPVQCDKYYECRNGTAEMNLCSDGLAFNEKSGPSFLRCDSLRDVDCKSRPKLQEPQPSKNCPRKFGLFAHETDCTKFWNCVDGSASEVQCPPGLTYNDERATCDWADLVEASATTCKSEDLLGFTCPNPTAHDLLDGVYARYPHPDNCQLHFTCIKGADGLRRPRMLSCNEGLVFDPETSACRRPEEVPGCEDFYGGRSQPPKKKPARQPARREPEPEPEPEELVEEPTPRPRRRGSNRRIRN